MEQEPGPRGSPQLPQPPLDFEGADFAKSPLPFADPTANAENCCSSLVLSQAGQCAFFVPVTMASNCLSHSLQTYSKIGMADFALPVKKSDMLLSAS